MLGMPWSYFYTCTINRIFNQYIKEMKKNMGSTDKLVRVLVAVVAALLVYFEVVSGTFAYILIAVAAIFVLTSLISFCPIYSIFGMNTCKVKKVD
jgi:hypothetical protein